MAAIASNSAQGGFSVSISTTVQPTLLRGEKKKLKQHHHEGQLPTYEMRNVWSSHTFKYDLVSRLNFITRLWLQTTVTEVKALGTPCGAAGLWGWHSTCLWRAPAPGCPYPQQPWGVLEPLWSTKRTQRWLRPQLARPTAWWPGHLLPGTRPPPSLEEDHGGTNGDSPREERFRARRM